MCLPQGPETAPGLCCHPQHTAQHRVQTPLRLWSAGGLGTILVKERYAQNPKVRWERGEQCAWPEKSLGSVEVEK